MLIKQLFLVSLEPMVFSDNFPARSLASIIHRLVRLQLTSPLAHSIAQLFEPLLFQLNRHNTICVDTRLKKYSYHFCRLKKIYAYKRLHYHFCRHNRKCIFILAPLFLFCPIWLSGYSIDEVKACRSVLGSLPHTYPQSLLHLTSRRRIITECTVL